MMRYMPSTDKHERKSAAPAVPASQISHFEEPELLLLLGWVRKNQCCHADVKSHLSKTALPQTEHVHCLPLLLYFILSTVWVCRLSALLEEKNALMQGLKLYVADQIFVHLLPLLVWKYFFEQIKCQSCFVPPFHWQPGDSPIKWVLI